MLHALITQREGQNMYGKSTDVLEAAYTEFYESMGIIRCRISPDILKPYLKIRLTY